MTCHRKLESMLNAKDLLLSSCGMASAIFALCVPYIGILVENMIRLVYRMSCVAQLGFLEFKWTTYMSLFFLGIF